MNIDKDIERCKELIKTEHSNWIGMSNQDAIENVLSELEKKDKQLKREKAKLRVLSKINKEIFDEKETWKKIAEKLAGYGFNCYYSSPLKFDSPEELIEVARNEVENEENNNLF